MPVGSPWGWAWPEKWGGRWWKLQKQEGAGSFRQKLRPGEGSFQRQGITRRFHPWAGQHSGVAGYRQTSLLASSPERGSPESCSQRSLVPRRERPTSHTLIHLLSSFSPPGQVDPMKLRQSIHTVLFNQFVISFPMMVWLYPILKLGGDPCRRELPTFHWFLLELAVFTLTEEVLFYYAHR